MFRIRLIDTILLCLGAMTVGLIMDVISLFYDWMSLFSLGTLIIAISLMFISISLYIELGKYKDLTKE